MLRGSDISPQLLRIYNRCRLEERSVSELIGFCHGAIADGKVDQAEAEYLEKWLAQNAFIADNPVMQILLRRVTQMLGDGMLDSEESAELMDVMKELVGGDFEVGEVAKPTSLPLDRPMPDLIIPQSLFCFTGTFAFGTRSECENVLMEKGGVPGSLTKKTNYLVIGSYATESWMYSSYGRKIEKACQMRDSGVGISIVTEDHWLRYVAA